MDDQILRAAFAVYHNPRAYALLLGSGVSRSAGIQTGQEIMEDLIRKLAHIKKQNISGEPTKWYENEYHEKPGYDTIIKKLGGNPVDRSSILREYFERQPDDDEGVKLPTRAHRAIARLIKAGYIQVVLTTNFDRLLELALEEVGFPYRVITTEQAVNNTPPIQHQSIAIVKLHGDYLESTTRNTADELAKYDDPIELLLDKVLREWGLIICGWSGEYDKALRDAFQRSPKCHYGTHWVSYRGDIKSEAKAIIDARKADQIDAMGADEFFEELEQNVMALQSLGSIRELPPKVAAERVRRLLSANDLISLETFLSIELEQAYQTFNSTEFKNKIPFNIPGTSKIVEDVKTASEMYFEVLETSLHMVATLTWHGRDVLDSVLARTLSRWMETPVTHSRHFAFERIPILLLIYAAGMAAVERNHWQYLQAVLSDPFVRKRSLDDYPSFLIRLFEETYRQYYYDASVIVLGKQLNPVLRPVFQSPLIASDDHYYRAFDLFEMILNLAYLASPVPETYRNSKWMAYHETFLNNRSWEYITQYLSKVSKLGNEWSLLKIEPFSGHDFEMLLRKYQEEIEDRRKVLRGFSPIDFSSFYKPEIPGFYFS